MRKYDPNTGRYFEDNTPLGIGNSPYTGAVRQESRRTSSSSSSKKSSSSSSSNYSGSYGGGGASGNGIGDFAIAGFIVGWFLPFINLIIGIILRCKSYRYYEFGRGMIIVGILYWVIALIGGIIMIATGWFKLPF